MNFFKAKMFRQVMLCSWAITVPLFAQVKDTAQKTQIQNVQPTAPVQPTSTPAVKYPPARQYPPGLQPGSSATPPQVQQAAPTKSDYFSGMVDGEMEGKAAAVGSGWVVLGCCGGVLGVLIPYILEPDMVSTESLVGKSNEYIMGFNEGYKKEIKGKRVKKAFTGCIISGVATAVYYVVIITLAASSGY